MSADIEIIRAPMGGAWACPLTDKGEDTLCGFFGEEPTELRPLCDRVGYIVAVRNGNPGRAFAGEQRYMEGELK